MVEIEIVNSFLKLCFIYSMDGTFSLAFVCQSVSIKSTNQNFIQVLI